MDSQKGNNVEDIGQKFGFGVAFLVFIIILNYLFGKFFDRYISYKFLIPGVVVIYIASLFLWRKK